MWILSYWQNPEWFQITTLESSSFDSFSMYKPNRFSWLALINKTVPLPELTRWNYHTCTYSIIKLKTKLRKPHIISWVMNSQYHSIGCKWRVDRSSQSHPDAVHKPIGWRHGGLALGFGLSFLRTVQWHWLFSYHCTALDSNLSKLMYFSLFNNSRKAQIPALENTSMPVQPTIWLYHISVN